MKIKVILLAACIIVVGFAVNHKVQSTERYNQAVKEYTENKENVSSLDKKLQNKELAIDNSGAPSLIVQGDNKLIESVFVKATTFKNGSEYQATRKEMESIVKAKYFFNTYMPEDKDVTGNSFIDGSSKKSLFDSISIYQMKEKRRYLTTVKVIPYTKDDTIEIKDKDRLRKRTDSFYITVSNDGKTIEKIERIKDYKPYN